MNEPTFSLPVAFAIIFGFWWFVGFICGRAWQKRRQTKAIKRALRAVFAEEKKEDN